MKNNILAGGLDRVDTAIDRLIAEKLEAMDEKRGLWANIHAKRKRGERAAKPGEKGYPKTLNIEASAVDRIDARFKKLSGRSMGDAAKEHGAEAERLQKEIDAQTAENERRKAAMKTEEVEEIDELSKTTLASYAKKGVSDARFKQGIGKDYEAVGKRKRDPNIKAMYARMGQKVRMKAQSREAGVGKAIDRLAKEEVELDEIDEGMKQNLRKYVPGYAKRELDKKMDAQAYEKGDSTKKTVDKDVNFGRYKKIADKLKNEEIELDEVSKKTLGSYVNKASVDMANRTAEGERKRTLAGADYAHNISRGMSAKTADADMKKDYAAAKPDVKKSVKRMYGISKAVGRLTKEEIKTDLPFKSDSKSNKPIAKPGRFGIGPSTAKHLAQMAMQKQIDKKSKPVTEDEQRMSRAAKGHEKYGKVGMQALAKAGRDGASEKTLDKIRTRHNKYNESLDEAGRMRGGGKDPCWTGYKMVGTKKKAGREVPNCVPTEDRQELKTFKALREELNGN